MKKLLSILLRKTPIDKKLDKFLDKFEYLCWLSPSYIAPRIGEKESDVIWELERRTNEGELMRAYLFETRGGGVIPEEPIPEEIPEKEEYHDDFEGITVKRGNLKRFTVWIRFDQADKLDFPDYLD